MAEDTTGPNSQTANEALPLDERTGSDSDLLPDLLQEAEDTLASVAKLTFASTEDRDLHDQAYRRLYYIHQFSGLLGIHDFASALGPAVRALDIGRQNGAFSIGSLDYVVKLSIDTGQKLLENIKRPGSAITDLAEIIDECERYLASPVEPIKNSIPRSPFQGADREITFIAEETGNPNPAETVRDDAPEELHLTPEQLSLVGDFCAEATEHLERMAARLLDLEQAGSSQEIINDLFRAIHTVKGGARLLAVTKMEALAHDLENLLGDLRSGERKVNAATIDVLMEVNKALTAMTMEILEHQPIRTPTDHLRKSINALRSGSLRDSAIIISAPDAATEPTHGLALGASKEEFLRVPTSKLDDVLNTASEVFVTRIRLQSDVAALTREVTELQNILKSSRFNDATDRAQQIHAIATRAHKDLTERMALGVGAIDNRHLHSSMSKIIKLAEPARERLYPEDLKLRVLKVDLHRKQLQKNVASLEALSARLQSGAMNFRMVPVSQLFNRFPPLARDMARKLGKHAKLEVEGGTTELDKVLVNQLVDPLIHILRNALDHGLESPSERLQAAKPEVGRIRLAAYYEGSYVVIEINDDGRGIDTANVLSRALDCGLITPERARHMSPGEIMSLVFEPGFSTKTAVSELSGRGVGMDVVKTAVQEIQGSVSLESEHGKGTRIRIKVPLTLAVVSVVIVEEHGYQFAIPVLNVVEVVSARREEIRIVSGSMAISFRGRTLPVTTLSTIMNFPSCSFLETDISIVVLSDGDREVGVAVDRLMGRHDVLIKRFGSLLRKLPYLMGCTILSDSRLVPVLNVCELIHNNRPRRVPSKPERRPDNFTERRQHSILVIDDSAIQRNRVASALTRAGYRTATAEDGFDALCKVREHSYSACCVDVFMPIIDGLEFVERLREAPETNQMRVFMMSGAMEQLQDQQRLDQLQIEAFFRKPFDVDDLISGLDRIFFGKMKDIPLRAKAEISGGDRP